MFLLDSATCIIDVNNALKELSYILTSNTSLSLSDRYSLTNNTKVFPWPVENSLYAFMVYFSIYKIAILNAHAGNIV